MFYFICLWNSHLLCWSVSLLRFTFRGTHKRKEKKLDRTVQQVASEMESARSKE